jgi:hypothetical protein
LLSKAHSPISQETEDASSKGADKQRLQVSAVACLLERNGDQLREENEPELSAGYRHRRSAIGALLTVEP